MNFKNKPIQHLLVNGVLLAGALLISLSAWSQSADGEAVPAFEDVEKQAMELKQSVLTYSEEQRQALVSETKAALESFDQRINSLEGSIKARSDEMSTAAQRYADDMMKNLEHEREQLDKWFTTLQEDSTETWDHIIYSFSRAYDNFYDSWEDLEAQFGSKY